ncbi:DMT family transporter [Kribbella koreensis]|uniref:DMT family transporter n=1 Tax=Kribbella koreensis TaxID=57909 RepID=A0ABP4BE13_9ACTN
MTSDQDRATARHPKFASAGLFVLVSVLWGVPYLFNDIALQQIGPLWIAVVRVAIAGLALGPLLLRDGRWRSIIERWPSLLLLAVVEVALPFTLIAMGQRTVPSGTTGVLIALEPIFVALIALWLTRGRDMTVTGWAGLAVGILGVITLLGLDLTGPGALLIVAAALSYAIGATSIPHLFPDTDSLTIAAAMILLATPILLLVALLSEPFVLPSPETWTALVVLGLACSAAGFTAFFSLIKRATPTTASITIYVSPIVSLGAGVVVLGERATLSEGIGCALILIGAALVLRRKATPDLNDDVAADRAPQRADQA